MKNDRRIDHSEKYTFFQQNKWFEVYQGWTNRDNQNHFSEIDFIFNNQKNLIIKKTNGIFSMIQMMYLNQITFDQTWTNQTKNHRKRFRWNRVLCYRVKIYKCTNHYIFKATNLKQKKKKLHDDITYTNMRSNFPRRPCTAISIQLSMNRDLMGQ